MTAVKYFRLLGLVLCVLDVLAFLVLLRFISFAFL